MRITKKYWLWDEKFNQTSFKLGNDIQELEKRNLVCKSTECEAEEYDGINGNPWKIRTINRHIRSITYRKTFFPFISENIWDMDYTHFELTVNKYLTLIEQPIAGHDIFYVVFRGSFIAIAMITRRPDL